MANPYNNKVQLSDGTTLIDLTGDTVSASDVAQGVHFHLPTGEPAVGTATGGAIIISDTTDVHGGTIREITAQEVVNLQSGKSVTPTESAQTVEPDLGYDAFASVNVGAISPTYVGSDIDRRSSSDLTASGATVSVPSGYYASNASKAVSNGSATTPATTITANPTISVNSSTGVITASNSKTQSVTPTVSAGYVSSGTSGTITVTGSNTSNLSTQAGTTITPTESQQTAVSAGKYTLGDVKVGAISSTYVGSGITQRSSTDLTASGATVTVPSGYYSSQATKSVTSGTAGTPTATKGAVSNHSISVTPSVTNTAGYISGGTINGTAVSVSASELVSGSQTITENDTYDVTNLAEIVVDVAGSGGSIYQDQDGYIVLSPDGNTPTLITKTITQNGTYDAEDDNASGYSSVTVNVSGGGGSAEEKQINFIDYDGTILHSYTKAEIQAMTAESDLPANPSHTGLTAQGWNWTLAQIKAQLTAAPDGKVWVGQMYITQSGDTELDCVFHEGRLSPTLTIAVNGTVEVDWGDNTTADTVTGTSLTTRLAKAHTYASEGAYTIKIHVVSGSFTFYSSSSYLILRKDTTANTSRVYANCIKAVRIGNNCTSIPNYAFYYCFSLASITIPSSVTSIGSNAFYYCYSLTSITIPSSVTSIENYAFYYCSSLASITIPSSVTSIGSNAFYYCSPLTSVTIPNTVTSIGDSVFSSCYSLTSITIPNGVTSIGSSAFSNCHSLASIIVSNTLTSIGGSAFNNCYGMAEYHFLATTPPTLGTSVFNNIQSDCIIYVPSSAVNTYKTAWNTYASYIQGE